MVCAEHAVQVRIIGRGRVGRAFEARLAERGALAGGRPDIVLLCVPDAAISEVARGIEPGPWVAHVSGATPLAHLEPHRRRFGLHPLQTFTLRRGPEQIDGAWAAVTAEDDDGRRVGHELAGLLGLRPFDLDESRRVLYHAGAVFASNFLVTLHRLAVRAVEAAGAPPEALEPLMRRTIDNGFDLTGPIARGDLETVRAHLDALARDLPDLVPVYTELAQATRP
nr:MAG: DUF2520 domain-containing protein [Acidobacteriota bacterium]